MGKLPAFQFYPADWRKDPGVRALNYQERGIWFEMICLMHESEKRGFLSINGSKIDVIILAKMLGLTKQKVIKTIETLLYFNVCSKDDNGVIYCRRMVKDEHIRQVRADAGQKGGAANRDNLLKQTEQQNIPPSSPSSPSPSPSGKKTDDKSSNSEPKILAPSKRIKWNEADSFKGINATDRENWSKAYPACDIDRQLSKMHCWLIANPKRIKSNYYKFINSWLTKDQDRGGGMQSNRPGEAKDPPAPLSIEDGIILRKVLVRRNEFTQKHYDKLCTDRKLIDGLLDSDFIEALEPINRK